MTTRTVFVCGQFKECGELPKETVYKSYIRSEILYISET